MCAVNAWILWRRNNPEIYMALFDFKQAIAEHLCKDGKVSVSRKRGRSGSIRDGTPFSYEFSGSPNPTISETPKTIRAKKSQASGFAVELSTN